MKFLEKKQSELLPRIEIIAIAEHTSKSTPSENQVKEEIAKELKTDKNLIMIKHIYSHFGEGKSKIIAYAYKDKESMKKLEKIKEEKKEAPKKNPVEIPKEEVKENGKKTEEK